MVLLEYILAGGGLLLLLSVLASKASTRFGVPALLLFLLIGMLAGSDGPGGIPFDNAYLAQSLGVVALAFILFSGGLDTHWPSVRPALWSALALSTLGVCVSAILIGGFAVVVFGFTLLEGVLLGAIVSSTDAAAVFSVLRTRGVRLHGQIEPLLELESGSNDPMAVFLTLGLVRVLTEPSASLLDLVPTFVLQMGIGAAFGYGLGRLAPVAINRVRLHVEGLYPVLSVALVLLVYGATASLGGNGFLAVYIAALVLGNHDFVHKRSILRFHDGLAWLMQIAMFLSLGLLVFPSRLVPVISAALLAALFLIFVARPVSVFVSLMRAPLSTAAKLMVSCSTARSRADHPCYLSLAGRRAPRRSDLQRRVFYCAHVGATPRHHAAAPCALAQGRGCDATACRTAACVCARRKRPEPACGSADWGRVAGAQPGAR